MDEINWLLRSAYFSLLGKFEGIAKRGPAFHIANMNRSYSSSETYSEMSQKPVSQHDLASFPSVCTGSFTSKMDGSWKLIREDVHNEEWCLVLWNITMGNILFGYVFCWICNKRTPPWFWQLLNEHVFSNILCRCKSLPWYSGWFKLLQINTKWI